MPTHYKGKTGAARKKALKEHKDAVKKDKKKNIFFNYCQILFCSSRNVTDGLYRLLLM